MTISINGKALDIEDKGISMNFKAFRFGNTISDKYSTDIKIPRTQNNSAILGIWGETDRSAQLFGKQINCSVTFYDTPEDAYLHITDIAESELTATLYISLIQYEIFDKKIGDVLKDDGTTIIKWNMNTVQNTTTEEDFAYYQYHAGTTFNKSLFMRHTSMRINKILSNLSQTTGVSFPSCDNSLYMLAEKKSICPQNKYQVLILCNDGYAYDTLMKIAGGQHIVNDLNAFEGDDEGYPTSSTQRVTFNRSCTANVQFWARAYHGGDIDIKLTRNNQESTIRQIQVGMSLDQSPTIATGGFTLSLQEGDVISARQHRIHATRMFCVMKITYLDYEITDKDYGNDLSYIPSPVFLPAITSHQLEVYYDDISYCYLGYYCNLADITLRDLIGSLCWYAGKKIKMAGKTMQLADATESKKIDALIDTISTVSDKIGKKSLIKYGNTGNSEYVIEIENDFLSESETIHESKFDKIKKRLDWKGAFVKQYTMKTELDENNVAKRTIEFNEYPDAVVLKLAYWQPYGYYLDVIDTLSDMGFTSLRFVNEISASTFDDVSECDFVYIDGRKYMMIEGDKDIETGQTDFTALELRNYTAIVKETTIGVEIESIEFENDVVTATIVAVGSEDVDGRDGGIEIGWGGNVYVTAQGYFSGGKLTINQSISVSKNTYYVKGYVIDTDGVTHYGESTVLTVPNYLTLNASKDSTVSLNAYSTVSLEYSYDKKEWTSWDLSSISIAKGSSLYMRGHNEGAINGIGMFTMTGNIRASGSVMSIYDNTGITTEILQSKIFMDLFRDCQALKSAPELPATTLSVQCYSSMFCNSGIQSCPNLPATVMADECYSNMFQGTIVTQTAAFVATTLAIRCYFGMYMNCTELTSIMPMNATILKPYCYNSMFHGCTSLNVAPKLPATELQDFCYAYMFWGCPINYMYVNFEAWSSATTSWLTSDKAGAFHCKSTLDTSTRDESHVPGNFEIINF